MIATKTTHYVHEDGHSMWTRSWWVCIGFTPLFPIWFRWYWRQPT
jgi:hypothetical protein